MGDKCSALFGAGRSSCSLGGDDSPSLQERLLVLGMVVDPPDFCCDGSRTSYLDCNYRDGHFTLISLPRSGSISFSRPRLRGVAGHAPQAGTAKRLRLLRT